MAHQFTKNRLGVMVPGGQAHVSASSLSESIMQHFFPPNPRSVALQPPAFVNLEAKDEVNAMKVSQAIQKCSNNSALDRIRCHMEFGREYILYYQSPCYP